MEPKDQIFPNYQNSTPPTGIPPVVPPPSPDPLPQKNKGRSVLGTNLIILGIYFILFVVLARVFSNGYGDNTLLVGYLCAYLAHAGILILFTIIRMFQGKNHEAFTYLLTAILIPIIGFGSCAVIAMTGGLYL